MLNNHPLISVPPECGFAVWLYENYKGKSFLDKKTTEMFINDVIKSRKFETWGIETETIRHHIFSRKFENYSEITSAIYFAYALKNGKSSVLVGDKNNFYIRYIDKIKSIYHDPKLIFIVRDGRDVASSYRELSSHSLSSIYAPKLPNSMEVIAHEWVNNNKLIIKESYDHSLLITYEDLVTAPRQILGKICIFLDVDYNKLMLEYYKNNDEPAEFLQWKLKTLEKPDPHNIGKYRSHLTRDEIDLFESIAGETLNDFGYQTDKMKDR
jgi:hypothetical protein